MKNLVDVTDLLNGTINKHADLMKDKDRMIENNKRIIEQLKNDRIKDIKEMKS